MIILSANKLTKSYGEDVIFKDVSFSINAGDKVKKVKDGALCNVAPTILKLMGIAQPAAMTAEPLI